MFWLLEPFSIIEWMEKTKKCHVINVIFNHHQKHTEVNHQEQITQLTQEIRRWLQCDKCGYKCTSKDTLTRHKGSLQ